MYACVFTDLKAIHGFVTTSNFHWSAIHTSSLNHGCACVGISLSYPTFCHGGASKRFAPPWIQHESQIY